MTDKKGALNGVCVLDLTDERGIYGAKLLADLGADVVRPEPVDGDPLRQRGPHQGDMATDATSLWHAFFASNRRFFAVDLLTETGREQLHRLVARAEIVLVCDGTFAVEAADLVAAQANRPELIVVEVTSFGRDGPWSDYQAPDLVAGALGGFCATTGDAETPPLKAFGDLNFMVSGAYAAIAALGALNHVRQKGAGQRVDVSVHECIASCLEQVFMCYWYDDLLLSTTAVIPRRGSVHWSSAYEVMQARGGSIMVTPTPDLESQLVWLVQEDAHQDLLDEKYTDPENILETTLRVMQVLREWVATHDVEELFFEAQSRHSPYGWVLPIEKVAENPQLKARDWWVRYRTGAGETIGPGAPYHFSETPWSMGFNGNPAADRPSILADIGWEGTS